MGHPFAALVFLAALAAPILVGRADGRRLPSEAVECRTIDEATRRQLIVRPAAVVPDAFIFRGADVTIREAWLGEIGAHRFESFFSDKIVVRGTGRYRLYFSLSAKHWPAGRYIERQNRSEVIEPATVTVGHEEVVVFGIDVPGSFPKAVHLAVREKGAPDVVRFQIH